MERFDYYDNKEKYEKQMHKAHLVNMLTEIIGAIIFSSILIITMMFFFSM